MDKLKIGEVIFKLRKKKGLTQDELGNFIGVSTAAVSKWESGSSYPDITLLPVLASFFNISIDELLSYNTELSDDKVIEISKECESLFTGKDISSAIEKSREYIEQYRSSYYLKSEIGRLFYLYCWKIDDNGRVREMIDYSIKLFEDTVNNCSKINLVEKSLYQLSSLYSSIGQYDKAIDALNKIHNNKLNINLMLSIVYIKKNNIKKARKILQGELWKNIFENSNICMVLANSYLHCEKDINIIERYLNLCISNKKLFSPECGNVLGLHIEYINFAQVYLQFGENEKALDMLHKWIDYISVNDINKPKDFTNIWCFKIHHTIFVLT
jgi:transcriptional regulator with XRE-family HTH domain